MTDEARTSSPGAPDDQPIDPEDCYGVAAQFVEARELLAAANAAREAGYRRIDAYAPFPVEGLADAVGKKVTYLPYITLAGGAFGAIAGYAMQYYTAVIAYPFNVGGRPPHSWPAFIPVTFEMTILFAALAAVFGMFALNRLPKPYHPLFHLPEFARATQDRFFLCIEARDPKFVMEETHAFLESHNPEHVYDVPN